MCVCTCTCVLSAAPEVEFDADSYSALVFPEETISVCLVYNYTDSEDRGQFDVAVNLTKDGTHLISVGSCVLYTQTMTLELGHLHVHVPLCHMPHVKYV